MKKHADYNSKEGIARFWSKDGLWHIALACPEVVNGLKTGGYLYTNDAFETRWQAIDAIEKHASVS